MLAYNNLNCIGMKNFFRILVIISIGIVLDLLISCSHEEEDKSV